MGCVKFCVLMRLDRASSDNGLFNLVSEKKWKAVDVALIAASQVMWQLTPSRKLLHSCVTTTSNTVISSHLSTYYCNWTCYKRLQFFFSFKSTFWNLSLKIVYFRLDDWKGMFCYKACFFFNINWQICLMEYIVYSLEKKNLV